MQHLCLGSLRHSQISSGFPTCQDQVRFFALIELNHMLHRLCGSPSIPLSFNLAAVLPRRRTYRVSCDTGRLTLSTSSSHRLWRGLPGYLILFAPHAFVPERRCWTRKPLSPLVFLPISSISPLHRKFRFPLPHPSYAVSNAIPRLSPGLSHLTYITVYARFTPSNSD